VGERCRSGGLSPSLSDKGEEEEPPGRLEKRKEEERERGLLSLSREVR
jgi:hypothetical protein